MEGDRRVTLSVVKADVGGFVGHLSSHPEVLDTARDWLYNAQEKGLIKDFHVLRCGDDIELILTHLRGSSSVDVHELVWNALKAASGVAREIKLYGAGTDLVATEFTGNLRDCGPNVAEVEFTERESEPVAIFMANKTLTGCWNLPLYKIFADPFNTSGLVTEPGMTDGFSFRVIDVAEGREITLKAPDESHGILALIGDTSRYAVAAVHRNSDNEVAAVTSSQKRSHIGDTVLGKSDPIAIVRCQAGLPAAGEVLEPFSFPYLVHGWLRASYTGPLMPVPFYEANPTRFDGPPRVICAGFQISSGRLVGPHDMFDDPCFDETRRTAGKITDYMRRHGPFAPHRIAGKEAGQSHLIEKLRGRFR